MTARNRKIFVVSVMVLSAAIVNPRSSIKAELFNRTHSRSIPEELLERAYAYGQEKAVAEMTKTEIVTSATLSVFNRPNEQSLTTGFHGLVNSFALDFLRNKWSDAGRSNANGCSVPHGHCKPVSPICRPIEPHSSGADCKKAGINRAEDGSCHDLKVPNYGMAGTTAGRLVPNRYADACDMPRMYSLAPSTECVELPDPRTVSITISQSVHAEDKHISQLFVTFGQFVDHDLTFTPVYHEKDKHGNKTAQPSCCPDITSSQCLPIAVAEDDPFYSHYDVTCLEFVRSLSTTTDKACGVGLRMQINQNSHWLDGSNVYGSGRVSPDLRGENGLMKMSYPDSSTSTSSRHRGKSFDDEDSTGFVPLSNADVCLKGITVNAPCSDKECCVYAGDVRAGEQPPLASMHTMWLRHHNTLAAIIGEARDDYSDDQIYQLARRILLAQYQFVVFNELLPEIIGSKRMMLYQLQPLNDTHYLPASKYVAGQGKILLEFSTAAGRFGHSLLGDDIFKAASKPFKLSDHLNRVDLALASPDDVGDLLHSASQHPALQMDQHITGEVQNKLFKKANPYGGDLFASNIQRGRDHGIGTYYDVRKFCLGDVSVDPSWSSPVWEGVFHKGSLNSLKRLYRSPLDVDLFAGGIAESIETAGQGVVGPTFGCVIAKQFQQLKFGDRFWFEFGKTMVSGDSQFTGAELAEIRKTSLARLMCDETTITSVTKRVLRLSKDTVQCDDPDFLAETGVDYNVFIPNAAF